MALDATTGAAILKKLYPANVLKNLTYKNRPFLSMVPKGQWKGSTVDIPLTYGNPAGVSATISTAITNKGNSNSKAFAVTMRKHYGVASIDNEIIEKSKDQAGAFTQALKYEVDNTWNAVANKLAAMLYRSGGGAIGQVGSLTGSTVITLKNKADIHNFEVGMVLEGDTADGGGTKHSGSEVITDIDRDAGTITAAAWTDISGIAADDYLFQAGDYDLGFHGLGSWVPSSAPGATAFFGVDRTADVSRLGGLRVSSSDVAGATIDEKLQFGLERLFSEGAQPSHCFLNPVNYRDLVIQLENRAVFDKDEGRVGFKTLLMFGPGGAVKIHADPFCPKDTAFILQMDTWMLMTTSGGLPKILDLDVGALRESTSDAYEVRVGVYGNLACKAPGFNCRVDLSE